MRHSAASYLQQGSFNSADPAQAILDLLTTHLPQIGWSIDTISATDFVFYPPGDPLFPDAFIWARITRSLATRLLPILYYDWSTLSHTGHIGRDFGNFDQIANQPTPWLFAGNDREMTLSWMANGQTTRKNIYVGSPARTRVPIGHRGVARLTAAISPGTNVVVHIDRDLRNRFNARRGGLTVGLPVDIASQTPVGEALQSFVFERDCRILAVDIDSVTLDRVVNSYSAGAILGLDVANGMGQFSGSANGPASNVYPALNLIPGTLNTGGTNNFYYAAGPIQRSLQRLQPSAEGWVPYVLGRVDWTNAATSNQGAFQGTSTLLAMVPVGDGTVLATNASPNNRFYAHTKTYRCIYPLPGTDNEQTIGSLLRIGVIYDDYTTPGVGKTAELYEVPIYERPVGEFDASYTPPSYDVIAARTMDHVWRGDDFAGATWPARVGGGTLTALGTQATGNQSTSWLASAGLPAALVNKGVKPATGAHGYRVQGLGNISFAGHVWIRVIRYRRTTNANRYLRLFANSTTGNHGLTNSTSSQDVVQFGNNNGTREFFVSGAQPPAFLTVGGQIIDVFMEPFARLLAADSTPQNFVRHKAWCNGIELNEDEIQVSLVSPTEVCLFSNGSGTNTCDTDLLFVGIATGANADQFTPQLHRDDAEALGLLSPQAPGVDQMFLTYLDLNKEFDDPSTDEAPPYVENQNPAEGEIDVLRNTAIEFRITDDYMEVNSGVDLENTIIRIRQDGGAWVVAYDGGLGGFQLGFSGEVVDPSDDGLSYDFVILPDDLLQRNVVVEVEVTTQDTSPQQNQSVSIYAFTTILDELPIQSLVVSKDGGGPFQVQVQDLAPGHYSVYLGPLRTTEDPPIVSADRLGLGTTNLVTFVDIGGGISQADGLYFPPLPIGVYGMIFVPEVGDTYLSTVAVQYLPRSFGDRTLTLRRAFPPWYKTGVRDPGSERFPQ